jgi:hypothetical protein
MTPQPRQPWDDEALDRALRAALTVDPAPEFRARVIERIAREPVPASRTSFAFWSSAAAAVAAGIAWVVLSGADLEHARDRRDVTGPPLGEQIASGPQSSAAPVIPDAPTARRPTSPRRPSRPPSTLPSAVPHSTAMAPDADRTVQFDPRERDAFAWFLSLSRAGELPRPDSLAPVALEPGVVVFPIEIAAIEISDVGVLTDDVTEGEPKP